jgi:phosphomethylpyrimidine synthase
MKITQDIRDYVAAGDASEDVVRSGLEAKSAEFREKGGEIYVDVSGD